MKKFVAGLCLVLYAGALHAGRDDDFMSMRQAFQKGTLLAFRYMRSVCKATCWSHTPLIISSAPSSKRVRCQC